VCGGSFGHGFVDGWVVKRTSACDCVGWLSASDGTGLGQIVRRCLVWKEI
jgi:hypothetical protein